VVLANSDLAEGLYGPLGVETRLSTYSSSPVVDRNPVFDTVLVLAEEEEEEEVPGPLEDIGTLTITRTDDEGNDLLTGMGETAVYEVALVLDGSVSIDPEDDDYLAIIGEWDLVLTLDTTCGHTFNNVDDTCTSV
jgi:hypothetical protein